MQQDIQKPKSKKRIPFQNKNKKSMKYEFLHSSAISPHPQKQEKGGEDAVFVSKNILVVADGVGSWKDYGIDPGIYSKNLISIISDLIKDQQKRIYYIQNPQKLACAAVNLNKHQGTTTLSIITLHPNTGLLKTYHIGDSIYGIFNDETQPILGLQQQYFFNHPYQVGSNFIDRDSNQQMQFSSPDSGLYNQFNYAEIVDSYIVLASDGIWDNLFTHQIKTVLKESRTLVEKSKDFADPVFGLHFAVDKLINITKKTYAIANYQSPFYIKGKQAGLNVGKFAKVDDLSLVIAKVIQKQMDV